MEVQFTEKKLVEVYSEVDDLVKSYKKYLQEKEVKIPKNKMQLSEAEIGSILVCYHFSGYKCFEYYYKEKIRKNMKSWFPKAPSYESFLRYIPKAIDLIYLWLFYKVCQSKRTNLYIIDSKKLPVCEIQREHSNRVFSGVARKGKSSTGWFYGLKIHLVINDLGEIVSFELTSGNVGDNNHDLLKRLLENLEGFCIGDKGYLSALFSFFYENKLHLLTKIKKTTKGKVAIPAHLNLIKKRAVIESVFDILGSVLNIEHTRHRQPSNAIVHIFSSLLAYQYLDQKPQLILRSLLGENANYAA